jgi:probable rRNA maturation factor
MIHIQGEFPARSLLKRAARLTLETATGANPPRPAAKVDLTVVLADDAMLREMNREYLGIDAPTDVLSFPASDADPETGRRYLGDVLISIPRAAAQAQAAGHSLEAEVQLLVVHGVLHLLGHDHVGTEEKARMWSAQSEVLKRLGLSHIRIREAE